MLNEFTHNPPKIHILGVDGSSLYIKETMVFLGNVPDNIYKEIVSVSKSGKTSSLLKQYYGSDWLNKLGFKSKELESIVLGGEDEQDIGDELDQLDLFDIGEEEKEPEKHVQVEIEEAEEEPAVKTKAKKGKVIVPKVVKRVETVITFVKNTVLFPEDKVSELKEKIYIAGGPAPYKQHIFITMRNFTLPLSYNIIGDSGNVPVDIRNPGKDYVLEIPIDREFYEMRDTVTIEAYDEFQTLDDIYSSHGTTNYYLVNIDEYMTHRGEIEEITKSDKYQLNLLYYSFVMKYWPMMTMDVFKTYLIQEKEMSDFYPDLMPSKGKIQNTYDVEKEQLNAKYELLADAYSGYKKNPLFKKYNPEFVLKRSKPSSSAAISVSIKNATLSVDTRQTPGLSGQVKLNVRNLFEKMSTSEDVPLIKVKLMRGRNPFILTKTKKKNIVHGENIQAIFDQVKYQIQLPYYNTILFAVRARDENGKFIKASQEVSKYVIFVLYDNGKYLVRSLWNEDEKMDFQMIQQILENSTKNLIDTINAMGRLVFASAEHLSYISSGNSEFTELSMSIFWKKTITLQYFNQIMDSLKQATKSQVMITSESEAGNEFRLMKGVVGYDLSQLNKYIAVSNYYRYLSDATVKQKWAFLFEQGRIITITHRTTDVKVEIQGIKENEFKYFYHYIISFLYQSERLLHGKAKVDASIASFKPGVKINTLKLLKARDPEAFIFKKFGSDAVYSRICQKEHQPIPFSPDEVKMLPAEEQQRAVKFWNYTTESDMYYLCRKGKFPYLNFITGQHPKNYCLACCKKTPAYSLEVGKKEDIKAQNKKERIHKQCMETHIYTEQEDESGTSRYVMIYGKDLYIGRIGKLPDTIQQYLLYNLENVDILSEYTIARTFTMNHKKYSVDRLFKITKNIKVHKIPVIDLIDHLKRKSWEFKREGVADIAPIEVIDAPNKNRKFAKHYSKILNADMSYPILVYDADEFSVIVDGLHRLSRAYIEKHPTIKVRYVTDKQLEKVLISEMDEESDKTIGISKDAPLLTVRKNKKVEKLENKKGRYEGSCDTCGEAIEIEDSISGGAFDEKKPGYYIYGVPQSSKNVSNIGVIYSLAVALNMEFLQLINFTIKILKDNPQYFTLMLNGELSRYFDNINDLVNVMYKLFRSDTETVTSFSRWNELFIDIARICFGQTVIIFDDTSLITTGTSMKVSTVDDINLILPQQVTYLEDIIPPITEDSERKSYILLLQRRKKSKSAFEKSAKVYYPIFIFIPYVFFKSQQIEKRTYTQNDEIMKLVRSMIQNILDEKRAGNITRNHIDFRTMTEFLEYGDYTISKIYVNSKDMCYAVVLNSSDGLVYIPIAFSYFSGAEKHFTKNLTDEDVIEYKAFDRQGKFTPEALKHFIETYNKFVVKKSQMAGMIKTVLDKQEHSFRTKEEEGIIPIYPLIEINKILVLSDRPGYKSGKKFSIIGLTDGIMHYYLSDTTNVDKFLKLFSSGYNVFNFDPKKIDDSHFQYLYYDPFTINELILDKEKEVIDRRQKLLAHAFYNKYLYRLFSIELIRYFDKDRDDAIRKKITKLIKDNNFKNTEDLNKVREQIGSILEEFPDDALRLQDQVSAFFSTYFDKKALLDEIETSAYEFDRITLAKVIQEGKDHWSLTAQDQIEQRNKIIDKLRTVAKNIVSIGNPKLSETYTNILSACKDSGASYCAGQKLVMPEEKLEQYLSLFADDLLNPMKRPYIMALIYTGNIVDEFKFERNPNEDIYIKF